MLAGFTLEDVELTRACWGWLQNQVIRELNTDKPDGVTEDIPYVLAREAAIARIEDTPDALEQILPLYRLFKQHAAGFNPPRICSGPRDHVHPRDSYNRFPRSLNRTEWLAARAAIEQSNARGNAEFDRLAALTDKPSGDVWNRYNFERRWMRDHPDFDPIKHGTAMREAYRKKFPGDKKFPRGNESRRKCFENARGAAKKRGWERLPID